MAGTGRISVVAVREVGTIQSTHQYDVDVRFDIAFDWGGKNLYGVPYSISCDGQSSSGTATFNIASGGGSWIWGNIGGTKTFRITMPSSGKTKTISLSATINTDVTPSTISASGSYTLSAVTWQWIISYNANGGSGAPGSQTKVYGTKLTLSSTKPTRTGYTFKGWATSSGGSVAYASGASYSANASVTLYAVWQINTYAVKYNANGGSGAPGNQTKTYGQTLTLSSTKPTRTNYDFLGWATSSSASSPQYSAGGSYTANAAVTLYAVWKLAYWDPKITSLKADRCDSSGTLDSYGTYAKVTFKWECCQTAGSNAVKTITVQYAVSGSTSYTSTTVTASGTSGSVSVVIGAGGLSTESAYSIKATVTDSKGGSYDTYVILNGAAYVIDFKSGGTGVAIGKPALTDGYFDVAFHLRIDKNLRIKNDTSILMANSSGEYRDVMHLSTNNVLNIGHEGYSSAEGGTTIYGNRIVLTGNKETQTNVGIAFVNYGLRVGYALSTGTIGLISKSDGTSLNLVYTETGSTGWTRNYLSVYPESDAMNISTTSTSTKIYGSSITLDGNIWITHQLFLPYGKIYNGTNQQLSIMASNEANYTLFLGVRENTWSVSPSVNNYLLLGSPSYRWNCIYANNATIQTSDRNAKDDIKELTDTHLKLFSKLTPVSFKMKEGTSGRTHIGFISQDVEQAMSECGLTDLDFAGFCRDKKTATVEQEDGSFKEESIDDYVYSLRYEEFIALNTKAIQHCLNMIDKLCSKLNIDLNN